MSARGADLRGGDGGEWARVVWGVAIVLGVGLRVARYLEFRGFWGDEAFLLLNVLRLPLAQLLGGPLNAVGQSQVAPPVFALALRGMVAVGGPTEWAMRLVPLACSLAGLGVMGAVLWRAARGWAAAGMTLLFAAAQPLIYQGSNVKQYSGDALAAAVVLWIAVGWRGTLGRRWVGMCVVGAGLVWMSIPVVFVLAGGVACLWLELPRGERVRRAVWVALPVASFGAMYFFSVRHMRAPDLTKYWVAGFAPWGKPITVPWWCVKRLVELFDYSLKPVGFILLLPALAAVVALGQGGDLLGGAGRGGGGMRSRSVGVLLLLPVGLAVVAGGMRAYPFEASRTTIYLLPGVFLLSGVGLGVIGRLAVRWGGAVAVAVVAIGALGAGRGFCEDYTRPFSTRLTRPAVEFVWAHRAAWEPVWVTPTSGAIVEVYWWGRDREGVTFYPGTRGRPSDEKSFWVVGSFDAVDGIKDADPAFLDPLGEWDRATSSEGKGWIARHYLRGVSGGVTGGIGGASAGLSGELTGGGNPAGKPAPAVGATRPGQ